MKTSKIRSLISKIAIAGIAIVAISFSTSITAKDNHDHNDSGRNQHSQNGRGKNSGSNHRHVEERDCGSHRHHNAHTWEGRHHQQFKCLGHK